MQKNTDESDPGTDTDSGYECDIFPAASRVDVWWPGDRAWYEADVVETRTEPHKIKGTRVLAREIFAATYWTALKNGTPCTTTGSAHGL